MRLLRYPWCRAMRSTPLLRGPTAQPEIARGIAPGTARRGQSTRFSSPNGALYRTPRWGSKGKGIMFCRVPGALPLAIADRRVAATVRAVLFPCCHLHNPVGRLREGRRARVLAASTHSKAHGGAVEGSGRYTQGRGGLSERTRRRAKSSGELHPKARSSA